MPNTVIALKKSATASAVPSSLANGELALNYADGKLYYKHANGTIVQFSSGGDSFGTVNVGGTLLVSDIQGDILTITAGENIVLTPDAGSDSFSISAPAVDNAFAQANTALTTGQAAFGKANTAGTDATNAFAKANTALTTGQAAFGKANTAGTDATNAFAKANTALTTGQAAFGKANTAGTDATNAFAKANTAQTTAVAAFDKANTSSGGGSYFQGNNGDVGSASGLGDIFRVHTNTLSANVTIYSGNNALAAGPITVAANRILTIQANARVAIV